MIERVFSAEGAMMLGWAVVVLLCASDPFGHDNSWGWRLLRRFRGRRSSQAPSPQDLQGKE